MSEVSTTTTTEASVSRTTIEPYEIVVCHGDTRVRFVDDPDLGVIIKRGQENLRSSSHVPHSAWDAGILTVSLGIDGYDTHEIHVERGTVREIPELLESAIVALQAVHDGILRVQEA